MEIATRNGKQLQDLRADLHSCSLDAGVELEEDKEKEPKSARDVSS
jgi:hypothetical protein